MHETLNDSAHSGDTFKRAVREAWDAAWNHGDVDALDDLLHPEYELHNTRSGARTGAEELKREVRDMRAAFPDLHTAIDTLVVEGESFALFWSSTGTFTNPLGTMPTTGAKLETGGSIHGVIRDGLILRERVTWDESELLAALSAPPLRSAFEESDAPDFADLTGAEVIRGFNKQFITGVTVVTAVDATGAPRGLAVNSYASVSFDPPLVLVCVQKSSSTYPALFESSHLGINILASAQRGVLAAFASKSDDKFRDVAWHGAPNGSPLLLGAAASLEAEIKERFQAKTHTVFIARVTHAEATELAPMVYKAGRFFDSATLTEL